MAKREKPWTSKAWLHRKYNLQKMSEQEIADLAKTTQVTINTWLRKFELKR